MNEKLISNWNSVVSPEDTIFHIGDFASSYKKVNVNKLIDRLNGHIILIKGNHDRGSRFKIHDLTFKFGDMYLHLVHNPEDAHLDINLVGHVHSLWKTKITNGKLMINVGVDVNNYTPVSFKQIIKIINKYRSGKDGRICKSK